MQKFIDPDELLKYGACPSECRGGYYFCTTEDHIRCAMRIYDLDSIDDCPKVSAILLDKVKKAREEIANKHDDPAMSWEEKDYGRNEMIDEVLEILDRLIESEDS